MLPPDTLQNDDRAALDFLLEAEGITDIRRDAIARRPDLTQRVSFAQRRLWFLHQLSPASAVYNIFTAIRLHGFLDLSIFTACFKEIVRRHEVLRTTFHDKGDGPEPCLKPHLEVPICLLELSELSTDERESRVRRFTAEQAALPFDLVRGALLRVGIAVLSRYEQVIVLVMHHIVADAWSMGVFVNELSELYAAFAAGLPSPLPDLSIQYADYSHWQWEHRNSFQTQLEFWRKHLHEVPQLSLPTDRSRPVQSSFAGAVQPLLLPAALVGRLKALGEKEHATMFMTLLAAFQILLSRYTGQTDIVVGTPIAGRNRSELEPLIGFFVNSIVLRVRWSSGASFREVLRQARTVALRAYENQDVPFDEVVRALHPGRDISHNPLFQVMFSVETEVGGPLRLADTSIRSEPVDTRFAKFDLALNLAPAVDGLCGGLEYSKDLFENSTARRMVGHFMQLLESICAHPDAPVARLAIVSNEERYRIVSDFNATKKTLRGGSLGQLFEKQAVARPEAVAVEFEGREWSYAELNQSATYWAAEFFRHGIRSEDRVAICMEPSFEMVVAVLAIIKAGASYVPLIPSYPDQRVGFILRDARARLLLTQQDLKGRLSQFGILPICLDSDRSDTRPLQEPARIGPGHLAYIIYTSGSTGEPKGIEVTHRAVLRLVRNTNYIDIRPDDCVALASNFAFDAATFELWGALLNGARVVGVQRDVALDPDRFGRLLRDRGVTTLFLTTALFNQIARQRPDAFATLRHLLFGGEAVDADIVRMILSGAPPARLLHVYGPTECTTFATWHQVRHVGPQDRTVLIGRPLSNTRAYVVDDNTELLPPGIPGELLLAGPGLARGYVNRPDLTASLFVPDPFSGEPGERLYRTGDLVRWRDNNELEFLGRIDEQVKIRGFRIEPAEIAATLTRHPSVKEAAVIVREDIPGKKQLVGYAVAAPGERFSAAGLRAYLVSHLPEYMIPSALVELSRLPLNANGKVDRKALPPPSDDIEVSVDEAPCDERQCTVAQAWCKVLHRPAVGSRQNYFELGGDSITAIQIVGLLKREGWQIQVRDIFRHPTVESLASRLTRLVDAAETRELQSRAPLTPIQRWFFANHRGSLHRFNQCLLLKCRQALDTVCLRTALTAIYRRHDALRTVFQDVGMGTEQLLNNAHADCALEVVHCPERSVIGKYADAIQGEFDLTVGPLFRAVLFRCDDAERLLIVAHHLVVDGVSWRIIVDELGLAYRQLAEGNDVDLGPPPAPWQQFAFTLHDHASRESFLSQLSYWRKTIETATLDRFPKDGDTTDNRFGDMERATFQLSQAETRRLLEEAGRVFNTEVNDLLLAALARALLNWRNIQSSILTLEGHGRNALEPTLDLNGTVGWFTSLFPFRLECLGSGLREQIISVKEALRRVPNGGVGYGILRYLTPHELIASGESDLFYPASLSFNYLGQFDAGSSGEFWELASESTGDPIASDLPRQHDLDLTAIVLAGCLNVSLSFHPQRHHADGVAQLLEQYRRELVTITEYCCGRAPEKTAIDFACKDFSQSAWDYLRQQHGWAATEVEDVSYLSPMQEGFLFHAIYNVRSRAYHLQMAFDVEGDIDFDELGHAWRDLAKRHSIFRTAFIYEGVERPIQVVLSTRTNPLTEIDSVPGPDQAGALEALRAADLAQGFDLARQPLSRVTIVRLADRRAHLIWSCHHLLVDGWSLGILSREFIELYDARVTHTAPALPPAPAYSEYLQWLQLLDRAASRKYWTNYLDGLESLTTIPRLVDAGSSKMSESSELTTEFDPRLTAELRRLATRENVTLNQVIQAIWALLLARYNGTLEVIFGTIVSGRPAGLQGAEHAVGLFINAIPVRVVVPPRLAFSELVQSIRDRALESERHHYFPLAEIQTLSEFGRDLISHLLIFENYPITTMATGNSPAAALTMRPTHIHDETHYDFNLIVTPGDRLHLKLTFNESVYGVDQITRIVGHLGTAAHSVVEAPHRHISEIAILPESERENVVAKFNGTAVAFDLDQTATSKIAVRAVAAPGAVAIRYGNESISYCELSARSTAIAFALRRCGVKPGDRVGLLLKRSPVLVASMLGVWKARAAYVPIDPDYPPDRIHYILGDCRCPVLLTESPYWDQIAAPRGCHWIDPHSPGPEGVSDELFAPIGSDTAYVIYTSGSTGTPKGCEITHRNLSNYLQWVCGHLHSDDDSGTYGLFTSVAFDLTVTSLFLPLVRGRTLHVFSQDADLPDILRATFAGLYGIDTVKCTPSHISLLRQLGVTASPLRACILGGEAVTADQVAYLHQLNPNMQVFNEYGPTETTVGCIAAIIPRGESRILIGCPIANTHAYILDRDGHPAPIGVPGEICIGGESVGRGYLFRPELTAERFTPDPGNPGNRIYHTGDIGRWLPDGTMEYLGRDDDQVKIRGHRVELAEVQQVLAGLAGVRDAVVLARRCNDETELVAYVVGPPETQSLHRRCREVLPIHMVPARIILMDRLPLTKNGKLDRARLLDPTASEPPIQTEITQPRTAIESTLVRIWLAVLGQHNIGVRENFFELGGHSLKAIQVLSRIHQELGRKVALRDLLRFPTIEALAQLIERRDPNAWSRIEPAPPQETYELSYAQKRVWLADRMGASHSLNTPEAIVYRGRINVDALQLALRALIERHESLRTAFIVVNGKPRQKVCPVPELRVRQFDLRGESDPDFRAKEIAQHDAVQPFNLAQPTPMRATLLQLSDDRGVFLLTMHHIIGDGWSRRLFYEEFAELYRAFVWNRPNPLRPLSLQYKDYAVWHNARDFAREESYWMQRLNGVPEGVALPFDFSIRQKREFLGASESLRFSPELTNAVRELAQRHGNLTSYVMLTFFKLVLYHMSRQSDLCVGLSCANRGHPEIEGLIGFFVNILPIRTRLSDEMDFTELLRQVVAATTQALEYQDYPLDLLIQKLNPPRRSNRPPLINVVYGFHDFLDLKLDAGASPTAAGHPGQSPQDFVIESGWTFSHETAKFDLTLLVTDNRTGLDLLLEYDRTLFRPKTAQSCLSTLEKLARSVTQDRPLNRQ